MVLLLFLTGCAVKGTTKHPFQPEKTEPILPEPNTPVPMVSDPNRPAAEVRPSPPGQLVGMTLARRFAIIPAQQLDESITPEQFVKMDQELEDVPFAPLWDPNDPVEISPPPAISEPNALETRKAYLQARRLLNLGQYSPAQRQISAGLDFDPNNAALYELLCQVQMNLGEEDAAIQSARRALELDDNRILAYQLLAGRATNQSEHLKAATALRNALNCRQATSDNPVTPVMLLQLAQALENLDYLNAAAQQYQRAFVILQNQARYAQSNALVNRLLGQRHLYLLNVALIQVRRGQFADAVSALRQAERELLQGNDIVQIFILSLTRQRIDIEVRYRQVRALCQYLLAVDFRPRQTLDAFWQASQSLARDNDYLSTLEQWYEIIDEDTQTRLLSPRNYAYSLTLVQNTAQARQILLERLHDSDEPALIHRDLAQLYESDENWREYIRHTGAWLENAPDDTQNIVDQIESTASLIPDLKNQLQSWRQDEQLTNSYGCVFLLGGIARLQNENRLAEFYLQQALNLEPNFYAARKSLIELFLRQNKNRQVLDWIGDNSDQVPEHPEMLRYAGEASMALNQWNQAEEYYRRFLDLRNNDVSAHYAFAQVLARQGELNRAEQILLEVAHDHPNRPDIDPQLLLLYARWSTRDDLTQEFQAALEKRVDELLAQMLLRLSLNQNHAITTGALTENDQQQLIAELEQITRQYPRVLLPSSLLSRLYFSLDQTDQALRQTETTLEYHPNHQQTLILAIHYNQAAGRHDQVAQLRRRLWLERPDDMQLLAETLQSYRSADQADEALRLLLSVTDELDAPDKNTIDALHAETLRLFMITRQYQTAAGLFQLWYDHLLYEDESSHRIPQTSDTTYFVGESLLWALTDAGCYDRAVQHARMLYQRYKPPAAQMALYLAGMLNARLLYHQSYPLLQELVGLQPDDLNLRLQLYRTMIAQGQTDNALGAARRWLEEQPDQLSRPRAYRLILQESGDFQTLIPSLQDQLNRNPDDQNLQLELFNTLLLAGEFDQADELIFRYEAMDPRSAVWLDARIKLDIARGNPEQALNRITEFTRGNYTPELELYRIQILEAGGKIDSAIERLEKLIADNPEHADTYNWRLLYSSLLERRGETDRAIAEMKSLSEDYPDDALLKNNLAYTLIEAHQEIESAGRLVHQSLRGDPESAPTLDSVGWFYYKKGDFPRAFVYITQAAARLPEIDPDILTHLGDVAYRLGEIDHARTYWNLARQYVTRRLPLERRLEKNKIELDNRWQQLQAGIEVGVAELFDSK